jgi:tRNA1Val (adenine37-N6)-methyltransferase
MNDLIKNGERIDDLQCGGLKVIQNPELFRFGTDAVLLANFAHIKPGGLAADLGTGCGVIPILLSQKTKAGKIHGIEIQERAADMAMRSVQLNALQERITIHHMDLKDAPALLGHGKMDAVTCNPPYGAPGCGPESSDTSHALSRFEKETVMEDILEAAFQLLKNGGRFFCIHQSRRLVEILGLMRQKRLEPKRLLPVQPFPDKGANLVLFDCVKLGGPGLDFLPVLTVWEKEGVHTAQMHKLYDGGGL